MFSNLDFSHRILQYLFIIPVRAPYYFYDGREMLEKLSEFRNQVLFKKGRCENLAIPFYLTPTYKNKSYYMNFDILYICAYNSCFMIKILYLFFKLFGLNIFDLRVFSTSFGTLRAFQAAKQFIFMKSFNEVAMTVKIVFTIGEINWR